MCFKGSESYTLNGVPNVTSVIESLQLYIGPFHTYYVVLPLTF